jgi:Vacuolar sorting protein 9 (VPS9) domain.
LSLQGKNISQSNFSAEVFLPLLMMVLTTLDHKVLIRLKELILFYEENEEYTDSLLGQQGYCLVTLMAAYQYFEQKVL